MPFHEITEPGPSQICVWIARGLDKLGPCDLEKIVEYNKIEYFILQQDDFDFVKRHYPMLMTKHITEGFEALMEFVDDIFHREIMVEFLEDEYCPDCGGFIKGQSEIVDEIKPYEIGDDRLNLERKSILKYDSNSNWIHTKEYDSNNKLVFHIENKYDKNGNCIESTQKSDITGESRRKTTYDDFGQKIKSFNFKLEKSFFGFKEIQDGFTEYKYDNNNMIEEIDLDLNNRNILKRSYEYDNENFLIKTCDNYGKTIIEYNKNGKKISETSYDEFGDFTSKSKFDYSANNLIARGYYDNNDQLKSVSKYIYDNNDNMVEDVYYKLLDKKWCEKCNKWVLIKKRDGPPKLEY